MTAQPLTPRRAKTQGRLLDAAAEVFAERGVLGSSVEEICERAGFTRGAFYSNFASRDEVCIALLERSAATQLQRTQAAIDQAGEPTGTLDDMLQRVVGFFVASQGEDVHTTLSMAELRLFVVRHPDVRPAYVRLQQAIGKTFGTLIEQRMALMGVRLRLPVADVIAILAGVYELHRMDALVGLASSADLHARLVLVLRSMIAADGDRQFPAPD